MKIRHVLIATALTTLLGACSVADQLAYKADIPQGNVIEQQDVERLKIGMTAQQVRFIMGSPLVVTLDDPREWRYVYRLKRDGQWEKTKKLVVLFGKDGRLAKIDYNE